MSKKYDHGFGYDESSSSNANEDSEDSGNYFGRKNKPNYYQPQMSKTGNKYDVNNPSYSKNMFIPNQNYKTSSNFGGGLNLGSLGGMNFNSTFNTKKCTNFTNMFEKAINLTVKVNTKNCDNMITAIQNYVEVLSELF